MEWDGMETALGRYTFHRTYFLLRFKPFKKLFQRFYIYTWGSDTGMIYNLSDKAEHDD